MHYLVTIAELVKYMSIALVIGATLGGIFGYLTHLV